MRRAFTLVEVLVTVSIIAMLVGLLLGGLRGAGDASRAAKCRSNLRQLFIASQGYAACNQGHLPAAVLYFERDGASRTVAWDFEQQAGVSRPGSLWKFSDTRRKCSSAQRAWPPAPSAPIRTRATTTTPAISLRRACCPTETMQAA